MPGAHMNTKKKSAIGGASALAIFASVALPSLAQTPTGLTSTFSVDQSLRSTQNPSQTPGNSDSRTFTSTDLGYVLKSETRRSEIELSASGTLRYVFSDDTSGSEDLTFGDETLGFSYTNLAPNVRTFLTAAYSRDDISFIDSSDLIDDEHTTLSDDFGDTSGTGTREAFQYRLGFQTNENGPFGWGATVSGAKLNYDDVSNLDLVDGTSVTAALNAHLDISPTIQIDTMISQTQRETDTTNQSSTLNLRLGATAVRSDNLSVRGQLFYSAPESNNDRFTISGGLTATPTARSSLRFDVGATLSDGFDTRLTGGLQYQVQPTSTSSYSIQFNSAVTESNDDDVVLNTAAIVGANFDLTSATSLSLNASFVEQENLSTDTTESELSAKVQLNRQLTQDWRVSVGADHTTRRETGLDNASSQGLFFSIGRDWVAGR